MRVFNPNSLSLWDTAFTVSASYLHQAWTVHCPFQVFQWALFPSIIGQMTGSTKIFPACQDGNSLEPSDATDSCRRLFRKLNILPIACQYILSLMLFIVDNQKDFLTNAYVHDLNTRNKNHLYLPVVSLSCVQKGVSCSGVKIFNSLTSNIQSYRNDRKRFKNKLYRYLIIHSFYSIIEFLECKTDKDSVYSTKLLLWLTTLVGNAFISIMCKFYN